MAFLSLVFGIGRERTQIGAMQLDALVSEENILTADVTSYAVETGGEISDHITQNPEQVTIRGIVTGASVMVFEGGGRSRLIECKEVLRQIHRERAPVTIVTGIDTYQDYAMTSAAIERTNDAEQLEIEAQFKAINLTEIQTTEIPTKSETKERAGKTAQKAGRVTQQSETQVPDDEAEQVKKQSLLYRIFH